MSTYKASRGRQEGPTARKSEVERSGPPPVTDESALDVLKNAFLFRGKTAEDIRGLLAGSEAPRRFKKGEAIYSCRSFRRALGILLAGRADVRRSGAGRTVLLNRLLPRDSFGAAALYGGEEYLTEIRAAADCDVLFIDGESLDAMLRADFALAENYIRFLSGRIRFLNRRIAGFTGGAAERRLALYLLENEKDGAVVVSGMAALARTVGVGRSSLYRSLDALTADGLIVRGDGVLRLTDLAALRDAVGE